MLKQGRQTHERLLAAELAHKYTSVVNRLHKAVATDNTGGLLAWHKSSLLRTNAAASWRLAASLSAQACFSGFYKLACASQVDARRSSEQSFWEHLNADLILLACKHLALFEAAGSLRALGNLRLLNKHWYVPHLVAQNCATAV